MKQVASAIIVDENLSRKLAFSLTKSFPGSTHVAMEALLHENDIGIWEFAKSKGFSILTKDWDYKFMSIAFGCPPKVIRVNCGNKTTTYIIKILEEKSDVIKSFIEDDNDCYLEIE